MLARILFCIASGLLFSHQIIAHQHHEDAIESNHHDHDNDDDSDSDHLPLHHIDNNFSLDNALPDLVKIPVQDTYFDLKTIMIIPKLIKARHHEPFYIDTGPLLTKYYKYFSLRAPPVS